MAEKIGSSADVSQQLTDGVLQRDCEINRGQSAQVW